MEMIHQFIDLFLHLDKHLNAVMQQHGTVWTYAILFVIIFCETGLVVTPILPGDSLLFAAGALAVGGVLSPGWLIGLLIVAAVLGDTVNYAIGHFFGPRLVKMFPRAIKKEYLDRTHAFYEKYGGETIILCRFVPIVRTFAPFVGGIGSMTYGKFLLYNVIGGAVWVALFIWGGYTFGQLKFVQDHFGIVELAIIFLSIMPGVIEFLRQRKKV